jgi:hypothetical protein
VPVCRAEPNKRKLTSLTVTQLRPAAKPYLIWDEKQSGLALQVQPSGYRAYKLIYRHHGRPRWYHIEKRGSSFCRTVPLGSLDRKAEKPM